MQRLRGGIYFVAENNMIPLKQWVCDSCGDLIKKPEDGWIEWLADDAGTSGFRICHHITATPADEVPCRIYDKAEGRKDVHLARFLGPNGLVELLKRIISQTEEDTESGHGRVKHMPEFVELIRRLQIPYYEQARSFRGLVRENNDYNGVIDDLSVQELQQICRAYSQIDG